MKDTYQSIQSIIVETGRLASLKATTAAVFALTTLAISLGTFALSAGSYWLLASLVDIGTFGAAFGVTVAGLATFGAMLLCAESPWAEKFQDAALARWPWQSRH